MLVVVFISYKYITDKGNHVARRARKVMGPLPDRQTTEVMRMVAASYLGMRFHVLSVLGESEKRINSPV
jgi:hypothetical protein